MSISYAMYIQLYVIVSDDREFDQMYLPSAMLPSCQYQFSAHTVRI